MKYQPQHPLATERPLDASGTIIVIFLCFFWGLNQIAVKYALSDIPPMTQAAIRSIGASVLIWLYARTRGIPLDMRGVTLRPGLLVGALFALEFALLFEGLRYTTASRTVLFLYLAPFVVVVGSYICRLSDRFNWQQWTGLVLSFAGLTIALGVPDPSSTPQQLLGDIMIVGAAVAWGLTTLTVKVTSLAIVSPEKTLQYQLVISAPVFVFLAWLSGETISPTPSAISIYSMIYQTVWVAAFTFLVWFTLIARYSASRLATFTFLTPLFGVIAGHLIMGDKITYAFGSAVLFVVVGLTLVNRRPIPR